jgi:hypothetical protein
MQDENKLSGDRSAAAPAIEMVLITSLREMGVVIIPLIYNFMNNLSSLKISPCSKHHYNQNEKPSRYKPWPGIRYGLNRQVYVQLFKFFFFHRMLIKTTGRRDSTIIKIGSCEEYSSIKLFFLPSNI